MAVKPKRTKLPTRAVMADDLVIVIDGKEYRPHAGESVTFRAGGQTMQDAMLQLRALALQTEVIDAVDALKASGPNDEVTVEMSASLLSKRQELQSLLEALTSRLASRIVGWSWTDNDGNAYQSPPNAETLQTLEQAEIEWLRTASGPPERTPEQSKNGSTPST